MFAFSSGDRESDRAEIVKTPVSWFERHKINVKVIKRGLSQQTQTELKLNKQTNKQTNKQKRRQQQQKLDLRLACQQRCLLKALDRSA